MPSPEELTPFANQVIDTLHYNGLDPSRCVLHGGTALGLYGIRQAGDLDLLVEPAYFAEMLEAGQTPGGVAVVEADAIRGRKKLVSVDEPGEDLLSIDASTFSWRAGGNQRFQYDLRFADEFEYAQGVLKVRPLLQILDQKSSQQRQRDTRDVLLIKGFLQRPENQLRF